MILKGLFSNEEKERREFLEEAYVIFYGCMEDLGSMQQKLQLSMISPPDSKVKSLPSHLKYIFLGENKTLFIIISSSLTDEQELKLFKLLQEYEIDSGCSIADIKWIYPSICNNKIIIDPTSKLVIQ